MTEAQNINREHFGYALWIPEITPTGQLVTIAETSNIELYILHAESPDLSELYFEVTAYDKFRDHTVLAHKQGEFLRKQSATGKKSVSRRQQLGTYSASTFDFKGPLQGRWKERRFLFLDGPQRTYRIVYDYTSPLNERVLETLSLQG